MLKSLFLLTKKIFLRNWLLIIVSFILGLYFSLTRINYSQIGLSVIACFSGYIIVNFALCSDLSSSMWNFNMSHTNLTGTLPVSRKEYIYSKYLFNNVSLVGFMALCIVLQNIIYNVNYSIAYLSIAFFIGIGSSNLMILIGSWIKNEIILSILIYSVGMFTFLIISILIDVLLKFISLPNYIGFIFFALTILLSLVVIKIHYRISLNSNFIKL